MDIPRFSVRNPVTVNLIMWAVIIGGIYSWFDMRREFFPPMEPEQIQIKVDYPGATPEEVEKLVARPIERELQDLDELKEIESAVFEGVCVVAITFQEGANLDKALNDVRSEMDKVEPDLPEDTEDPEISESRFFLPALAIVVYGDVSEDKIHQAARKVRDDLIEMPDISRAHIAGTRNREIWIEILPEKLEEHGLTFAEVGRVIAASNLDVPAGQLKGSTGNIRVRTLGQEEQALEIEKILVHSKPDGSSVTLADVGLVKDTFEDKVERGRYGDKPAAEIIVFKAPEEDALVIASTAKAYVADPELDLPGGVEITTLMDFSRFIEGRLDLMIRNARVGLILVAIVLALFLQLRVALWVGIGLCVAFIGTFLIMNLYGTSINLISMFGLIVVLGLIVDDAIVIGENIYSKKRQGLPYDQAAIEGSREVSIPVVATVLTTCVAFLPMAFMEGRMGAFLGVLPVVVICALSISLVEAFLILPSHLAHEDKPRPPLFPRFSAWWNRVGTIKQEILEEKLPKLLERSLGFGLRWRYALLACAMSFSIMTVGLISGGFVPFVLFPEVDAEIININLEMAPGTPEKGTLAVVDQLEKMAFGYEEVGSCFTVIGTTFSERGARSVADPATVAQLGIELLPADLREAKGMRKSSFIVNEMRQRSESIPGISKLVFLERSGAVEGADIEIRIRAEDLDVAKQATDHVRQLLDQYEGTYELFDNLQEGKLELQFELKEEARSLGLTTQELALQVRHALFGFEAQKIQEEDEEIKVRVLLPESERREIQDLARLRIRTPAGGRVPLEEVAHVSTSRGYGSLTRVDGKRAVTLSAQVDDEVANVEQITQDLGDKLDNLGELFPGATFSFEGRKKETNESVGSLKVGFPAALLMIYAIIAILFRSYFQPMIVMATIPFALVGAIWGHWFMGLPLTLLSMIGCVALAGIVVNDSLILVNLINRLRRGGMETLAAVIRGARSRLRAILLTTITTCAGLAPLMLETSFQAQFLIPMAVSIVFGLAFATFLTLFLVPTIYIILEDIRSCLRWIWSGRWSMMEAETNT